MTYDECLNTLRRRAEERGWKFASSTGNQTIIPLTEDEVREYCKKQNRSWDRGHHINGMWFYEGEGVFGTGHAGCYVQIDRDYDDQESCEIYGLEETVYNLFFSPKSQPTYAPLFL